jgi:hypothetical protein
MRGDAASASSRGAGPTATISSGSTPAVVNRLAVMRGPGEHYRDVILRLGEGPISGPRLWRAFN